MFTYAIILAVVLVISPFVLRLASNQKKEAKKQLKNILLFILSAQIILGFFNWENFRTIGLGLFFIISLFQLLMLLLNKYLNVFVFLNFINSVLIFVAMIKLSNDLGYQVVNLPSISSVFLVLFGNVIALVYVNRDKNLLKKYF